MGNAHPHRLYLPAGGRDEYRLWNLTGLRRDSETFGVVATLKPGISYAIFGALMWTSMGMCVLGFSSMDFSTKDRSSSWECGRYQLLSPCPPRGSAKSGQVLGWVMSLMARFGRRDRDLVVEAIPAPGPWTRRMRPMARLRRAAMISGPLRVRSWWRSSSKTTSLTQWSRFSIPQCPWTQAATCLG